MKTKLFLVATVFVLLLSSCVKDPEPPKETRFSVLGDSYSTFEGYVKPDSNIVWPFFENIGVTEVEQTWWYQVEQATGWSLERNNSYSGSLISNFFPTPPSFIKRMDNLGDPDVIFVLGGTNDVWYRAPLGEYVYDSWSDDQLRAFRPALAYLFSGLKQKYPEAEVYFMLDMSLGEGDQVETEVCEEYRESIRVITDHYGIDRIDLLNIHKDWLHPDAEGMSDIASQVVAALGEQS